MVPDFSCWALFFLVASACHLSALAQLKLTILHTNDCHARIELADQYGSPCSADKAKAGQCFGGVARRFTAIKQVRQTSPNVLLLDGGDQFQGTLWYNAYKGVAARVFMNLLKYDAMALGNHEFDDGIRGVVPFLKSVNFNVVDANIDGSKEPLWPKSPPMVNKSVVLTRQGQKIGIIGYTITETRWISSPGPNLQFSDEVQAVKTEAARLKAAGIKIIIALGHAGIDVDKKIAAEVSDVDIVVGGHTNTFLYTGPKPSNDEPAGPYPLVINPKDKPSHKTLVVQDAAFGKYLGNLSVELDVNGEIVSYSGNPILLDKSYTEDPAIAAQVASMKAAVDNLTSANLGSTHVFLDGQRSHCRLQECNLGNMIADAMVEMNARSPDEAKWAEIGIALMNGGGIRTSINKNISEYITNGDVLSVLPFGNTADIVVIKGKYLLEALEHSVAEYDSQVQRGGFLQMSGMRVVYDLRKPAGSRVLEAWILCSLCRVPKFEKLNPDATIRLLMSGFIASGGDGFTMIARNIIERHSGSTIASLVSEYIKLRSPIIAKEDQRIQFNTKSCISNNSVKQFMPATFTTIVLLGVFTTLLANFAINTAAAV